MALSRKIYLQDFQPDSDPLTPGIVTDCNNIIGTIRGLRVLPGFQVRSDPLPAPSLGAYNAILFSGDRETVVGTATHLYILQGGTWVEFDSGQTYNARRWRFAVFGNDILAVNGIDEPQISINTAPFIPISSAPGFTGPAPIASIVETTDFGVFMVVANSAQWFASALTDVTWAPSIAGSVAEATLTATPGPITAAHRLRGGIAVYKQNALYFGQFTGPPFLWSFVSVSEQVGTPSNETVVNAGDVHYFLGTDDFYVFDGSSLQRVPNNVKAWFFERVDQRYMTSILGQYDRLQSAVFWRFPTLPAFRTDEDAALNAMIAATGGTPTLNEWLCYNTRTQKWTKGSNQGEGEITVQDVVTPDVPATIDLTYEEFAARFDTYDGTDDLSYDDPSFSIDGDTVLAVITSDGFLATMDGPPMPSFLVTGEIGDGDHFFLLDQVRPIFALYPTDHNLQGDPYARLQTFYSMINGYPRPDFHDFPAPFIGPFAWITKSGAWYFTLNARIHILRMEFKGFAELTGYELSLTETGTQ